MNQKSKVDDDDFAKMFEAWEQRELAGFLKKAPERQEEFRTST
jgi:hypothetical protein